MHEKQKRDVRITESYREGAEFYFQKYKGSTLRQHFDVLLKSIVKDMEGYAHVNCVGPNLIGGEQCYKKISDPPKHNQHIPKIVILFYVTDGRLGQTVWLADFYEYEEPKKVKKSDLS